MDDEDVSMEERWWRVADLRPSEIHITIDDALALQVAIAELDAEIAADEQWMVMRLIPVARAAARGQHHEALRRQASLGERPCS